MAFPGCGSPASGGAGALGSSGDLGAGGASGPDTPVTDDGNSNAPAPNGPKGGAELREPDPDIVDPRPVDWDKAKRKGRKVTVFYYSGVKECYGLHHIDVNETDRKVTITVFDGTRPEVEVCIEIAQRVRSIVKLARPLGNREIVDGAE
ncbi:MAG: hypothetical protein ACRDKT_15490 [Actinomycetota bacterium]